MFFYYNDINKEYPFFISKNHFFLSKLWYGFPYQPKKVVRSEPYQPYRVLRQCNSANCFSVIADETTDVSTTEQISLCVRYVGVDSDEEMCVKESFLGFAGEELAMTIMAKLREYGIVTQAMRGQGYDGAANMSGKFSGVRTRIQTEIPEAYYVHCYAHCLNLAVVKSCQLPIVRNTIDTVKDVSYAFHIGLKPCYNRQMKSN